MKDLFVTLIIGIGIGIALQIWLINPHYPGINNNVHDTVYVDSIDSVVKDSFITTIPKTMVISLDSVRIDTISTVVNGQTTDAKYKITIK